MSTILQQPEAAVAHLLELRSFTSSLAEDALELLNTEEALCGMSAAEQKDTQQLPDSVQRDCEKSAAFCDTLRELLAKKKKGRKRKAVNFPGRPELKLEPLGLQQYLPVDRSRLYRDSFNGRWIGFYSSKGYSASKSWGQEGDEYMCVKNVLGRLWKYHSRISGEICPWNGLV